MASMSMSIPKMKGEEDGTRCKTWGVGKKKRSEKDNKSAREAERITSDSMTWIGGRERTKESGGGSVLNAV